MGGWVGLERRKGKWWVEREDKVKMKATASSSNDVLRSMHFLSSSFHFLFFYETHTQRCPILLPPTHPSAPFLPPVPQEEGRKAKARLACFLLFPRFSLRSNQYNTV